MENEIIIFICPTCFRVCDTEIECHEHVMVKCNAGELGDDRRKPVYDEYGNMVSRAPRWYLEALGWIEM